MRLNKIMEIIKVKIDEDLKEVQRRKKNISRTSRRRGFEGRSRRSISGRRRREARSRERGI
jgi:hypothetical protein